MRRQAVSMSLGGTRSTPLHQARVMVLTVERVTIGFVLEEQAPPPDTEGFDLAEYTAAYPTMVAGITEYFKPGRTVDDLFLECVTLVVEGP